MKARARAHEPGGLPVMVIVLQSLAAEGCPQLALQLARHWQQQGYQIALLCLQQQPDDLRCEFEALAIPIRFARLGWGLARYPRLLWVSFGLCRAIRPQAVLCFPFGWHALLAIGARLAGTAHVCAHVGNLPPVWTGSAFAKFWLLVQLGRPFTRRLLCCSEAIRSATIRDFRLTPGETRAVVNACDLDRFALPCPVPSALGHPLTKLVPIKLVMVARLESHKDQPTLLRAVALLRNEGLPLELSLIGEGSQRPRLEALIRSLQLEEQVHVPGSRRDIPQLLRQMDLFVFAAKPDEGFGIAMAEAMAAGLPIVASDVPACREVLDAGRCGLLVAPASPAALAAGIRQVLGDPVAARARAAAAHERALRLYSVPAMARAYAEHLGLEYSKSCR